MDILVAFSGGIDSCAAIDLVRSEGYEPQAVTIDMMGDRELLEQARLSAERLDVQLHIVDGRKLFNECVVDNFVNEYLSGRTPAPCTRCNPLIKWRLLAQKADELGIYHIASGHYFNIERFNDRYYVSRGDDPRKDQSYYLWGLTQDILARIVTPMGSQIKEVVMQTSVIKRESMGICFLRGCHYGEFLSPHAPHSLEGEIVNRSGVVVGQHNGIYNYTIGQKRGVGIPSGSCVVEVNATKNQIVIGDNSELFHTTLLISDYNIVDMQEALESENISVMVRGIGVNPSGFAKLSFENANIKITLSNPAWAAAPGQPIVLYIGRRVIGGGYLVMSE